ncbi:lipoprotein [Rhodanobacter ginsengiterrae]|uniref:LptM family lipoprotein n=1 Tax=Rhodanobacter ginsengiterrae TaxID=2008451 RepID=UPI003CF8DB89
MKRLLSSLILVAAAATLSGCYYDPGYSYVRGSGYGGDTYYGAGSRATYVAPVYDDGYYGGYYGGGYYGCCYAPGVSVGISSSYYGAGSRYRDHDHDRRDYRDHAGHWQGRADGDHRGNSQGYPQGNDNRGSHGGGYQRSHEAGQGSHGNNNGGGRGGSHGHRGRDDDRH